MDNSTLQSLLGGGSTGSSPTPSVGLDLSALMPFMVGLTILSILVTVLYLVNVVNHWRVNSAILEMRKLLREINERQKEAGPAPAATPAQSAPVVTPPAPRPQEAPSDTSRD